MCASLRTLLTAVIDYAGLFPPARLPLEIAFSNFRHFRSTAEHWMLGRFVIPVTQLDELAARLDPVEPLSFSILGRGGSDGATFLRNLADDLSVIQRFQGGALKRPQPSEGAALELRLPPDVVSADRATQTRFLRQLGDIIAGGLPRPTVALEAGFPDNWRKLLPTLIAETQQINAGFKLRCGGLDAAAVPTIEQVAFVLHHCRLSQTPVKFTAGLHHPFRHFNVGLGAQMHGFINVFAAGVLAQVHDVAEDVLCKIVADGNAEHFHFFDDRLQWHDLAATNVEIANARSRFVTSFGSCSFEEPLDDLRQLDLL